MRRCSQEQYLYRNRKERREKMLQRMAQMRAAKERKRLANPVEREPKFLPFYRLQFAVRDKLTGDESAWYDLRSGRDCTRRIGCLLREYK